MWIELSTDAEMGSMWVNTDHIVRIEFLKDDKEKATIITTKPGGSDRTVVTGANNVDVLNKFLKIQTSTIKAVKSSKKD